MKHITDIMRKKILAPNSILSLAKTDLKVKYCFTCNDLEKKVISVQPQVLAAVILISPSAGYL